MRHFLAVAGLVACTSILACGGGGEDNNNNNATPTSIGAYLSKRVWNMGFYYNFTEVDPDDTTGLVVGEYRTFASDTSPTASAWNTAVQVPGTSGLAIGADRCHIGGTFTFTDVPGFSPLERQAFHASYDEDNCGTTAGSSNDGVLMTFRKDAEGPSILGRWYTTDPAENVPTSGFLWEGGTIGAWQRCPANAKYGDAGCLGTCWWGPGTGADCPILESGTLGPD